MQSVENSCGDYSPSADSVEQRGHVIEKKIQAPVFFKCQRSADAIFWVDLSAMNIAGLFSRPLYWLAGKVFSIWARPEVQPDVPAELIISPDAKVCYVLETGGLADVLALERAAAQHGMPSPTEPFEFCGNREYRRFVVLRRMKGFWYRRPRMTGSQRLKRLVEAAHHGDEDLLLIPVAIYWGRSPEKERSLLKLLFSENWDVIGRTRKFFATILHGRNTLLRFSHALPMRSISAESDELEIAYRKVSRVLRTHFRQRRVATVGPDLSHRRTLIREVLRSPAVRQAILAESGDDYRKQEVARRKAEKYALEIAADISYPTIRVLQRLLRWLWSKIYDGIELNHMEKLHEVAKDKEVIYTPCHRSHIDYLLLGYVTYTQGLQLPHIAAGINLNLPMSSVASCVGGVRFSCGALLRVIGYTHLYSIPTSSRCSARGTRWSTSSRVGAAAPGGCCSRKAACWP